MKRTYTYLASIMLILLGLLTQACHKDEPKPDKKHIETSILLYAVASNNLSTSFNEDMKEMKQGLKGVDLSSIDYYVYYVRQGLNPGPTLVKAVKTNEGDVDFQEVRTYDRSLPSTDPKRISEVIREFSDISDGDTKGLILWSHSTAWAPAPGYNPDDIESINLENLSEEGLGIKNQDIIKWWGQDVYQGVEYYCELPDLASAIPDNYFDFIWFDCCYMSSIEVIYELRNKAGRFVAYPTEVLAEGAPYDVVLPLIATSRPDLIAAADAMSEYYLSGNKMFTVAVIDPAPIEEIADMAQQAIPGNQPSRANLIKYSRGRYGFYDFGQYTSYWGESLNDPSINNISWNGTEFSQLMNQLILYKNCSNIIFTGMIDKEHYSGISCGYFNYDPNTTVDPGVDQIYYTKLDWFKRVYKPLWQDMFQ